MVPVSYNKVGCGDIHVNFISLEKVLMRRSVHLCQMWAHVLDNNMQTSSHGGALMAGKDRWPMY